MYEQTDNPGLELIVAMIGNSSTQPLIDVYAELCDMLDEMNFDSHLDELDLLYSKLNSQEMDFLLAREAIYAIMWTAGNTCLNRSGVEIVDDTPLNRIVDMVKYILQFEVTEEPDVILTLVDSSEDNVDVIAAILELKTQYDRTTWYEFIETVNDSTVGAIQNLLKEAIERQESYSSVKLTLDPEIKMKRLSLKEAGLASELSEYITESKSLEEFYDANLDHFMGMNQEDSVRGLVELGILSNEGSNLESSLSVILDDLYFDPLERLEANKRLAKYLELAKPLLG